MLGTAVVVSYLLVLAGLTLFGLHRLHLLWLLWRFPPTPAVEEPAAWPRVLIQLPLYNEANVVERLIDAVARIDYPRDLLEVQVLDDSTDETRDLVAERVAWHRGLGLAIEHLRRPKRTGYKAGALAYGLERSDAELVAIFDADFVPEPDFLRHAVPHFQDREVGLVQGCWGHLNRSAGLLTRLQAIALDAHFRVEQAARSRSGRFFNFNGTAGVWRRVAIETAGGWAADTITEDLDLSLRAQLCGWRFLFLDDLLVPAELPERLDAFRTQQQRWARGSGQTARKLLREVWRAPEVPLRARVEATFQLLLNAAYPLLLLLALLTVPLVAVGSAPGLVAAQWILFGLATGSVTIFYMASQHRRGLRGVLEAALLVPFLFALGLGLSLSNGLAYLRGVFGGDVPFVRTPKTGGAEAQARSTRWGAHRPRRAYQALQTHGLAWTELGLGFYGVVGIALGAWLARPLALPFLVLIVVGFLSVGGRTLIPGRSSRSTALERRSEPAEIGPKSTP